MTGGDGPDPAQPYLARDAETFLRDTCEGAPSNSKEFAQSAHIPSAFPKHWVEPEEMDTVVILEPPESVCKQYPLPFQNRQELRAFLIHDG